MLYDYKIDIETPLGDETESRIVVWGDQPANPGAPIIDAPAAAVEAFALRLIQAAERAKRKRHPSVQRG